MRITENLYGRAVRCPHSSRRQRCRRSAAVRVPGSRAARSRGWRQAVGAWRPQARATARTEARKGSDRTEIGNYLRRIWTNCACVFTLSLTVHTTPKVCASSHFKLLDVRSTPSTAGGPAVLCVWAVVGASAGRGSTKEQATTSPYESNSRPRSFSRPAACLSAILSPKVSRLRFGSKTRRRTPSANWRGWCAVMRRAARPRAIAIRGGGGTSVETPRCRYRGVGFRRRSVYAPSWALAPSWATAWSTRSMRVVSSGSALGGAGFGSSPRASAARCRSSSISAAENACPFRTCAARPA